VKVPAATYRIDKFAIPFDITTVGDWTRETVRSELVRLGRGSNGITEYMVTSGLVVGTTPQEALDGWCGGGGGAIHLGPATATTLLGQPALVEVGDVTDDCYWASLDTTTQLVIPAGNTVILTAADVKGAVVVVVVDGPAAEKATLTADAASMLSSMVPVG
jgi:hypothetical protein